ncbi:hypothetical protein PR202_gb02991 [Eleusine coracana subsp. coracana]|uniref:Uncharacterized protein n=1 Tax=Eleusine coracana subsp. coracana TaxID=191504 RepID=A0AAV5E0M3_ELECO|nr:hypothetical protein QOZ80_8BG0662290 [Eleusine coracana subsp. coracana]GJN16041.1 hypothetical protein PR202_gb02991 [Eleusine coracana subsp. coracana]
MPVDVERASVFEAAMPPPASVCSSSSIGKDSDDCAPPGKDDDEEGEVQSAYMGEKGGAGAAGGLVGLEALEAALPIRRSISKFYSGKSKSFACLKEAITSSGSAKDISKAENAYSRKRKNLLAYSVMYENSNETAAVQVYETGPPKRATSLSRSSLLTMASSSSSSSSSSFSVEDSELPEQVHYPCSPNDSENYGPPKTPTSRPGSKTPSAPVRSFSMMDLPGLHSSSSSVHVKDKVNG